MTELEIKVSRELAKISVVAVPLYRIQALISLIQEHQDDSILIGHVTDDFENEKEVFTTQMCDGCNVNKIWEHRCHGENCNCDEPSCMHKQGKITWNQLIDIVKQKQ